jgi:hypothetical protein|tara:strand:+ start:2556 stop:4679 length:2124 start_codon:yes stop_codon:yes gene_type:complete
MNDYELKAIISSEIQSSLGYLGGELTEARAKSLDYYFSEPFGNEQEGRSQVISTDVADTIESILPQIMRTFTASPKAVQCVANNAGDESIAKQATDYLNHVFYKDNDGFTNLYTFFKDALLQKNGIIKVFWDDSMDVERSSYYGLTDDEFALLLADPEVKVLEHTEYERDNEEALKEAQKFLNDQMIPDQVPMAEKMHDVVVNRVKKKGKVCVENVPPEEFLIARNAKSIPDAHFTAHRKFITRSELVEMGFDPETIAKLPADVNNKYSEEKVSRKRYAEDEETAPTTDKANEEILIYECYMKLDEDEDGIAELRKVTVAGDSSYEILDNVPYDRCPFVSVTPILVPHRFYGRSISELVEDVQLVKSTIMRQLLDNMYLTNNNRVAVMDGQVNIDDLLTNRPGGIVRTKQPPQSVIQPMASQPLNQAAMPLLEYLDTVREQRTGITRYSQGMDADSLNKTASGLNQILTQAQMRVELICRVFAETGVKQLFNKILEVVTKYETKEKIIRVNEQYVTMMPMEWANKCNVEIQVGLGTGSKDQELAILNVILERQIQAINLQKSAAGPMVNLRNVHNTLTKLVEAAGLRNVETYFTDPVVGAAQMPPPLPPQPTEFEKVTLAQVQGENQRKILDTQIKEKELELKTQEMMLNMEVRLKELEAKYQMSIDSNEIKKEIANIPKKDNIAKVGDLGQETVRQQQQFFDPKNQ